MYSCLCSNGLSHHSRVFSSGACLAFSHLVPLTVSYFSCSFVPSFILQQGDVSNEGRAWPKEHGDHHQLYSLSLSLSLSVAVLHLLYGSIQPLLFPLLHSFSLSFPHLLFLNSTFHQLLVSPNSCHVDVDGLGTLRLTPCKCGSLKWRVG